MPRNSPVAKRGRKFSFCCGVPKRSTAAAMIRCELKMPASDIHTLETRSTQFENLGFDQGDAFVGQVRLEGARYPVPTAPGLGIEINEDYLKRAKFKFSEPPHLKRRDGSVTNW